MTDFSKLLAVAILMASGMLGACSNNCTDVCTSQSVCFGKMNHGSLEGCISQCEATSFDDKQIYLDCLATASCSELQASSCAPSCAKICNWVDECSSNPAYPVNLTCTTQCNLLTAKQKDCLTVNSCPQWQNTCSSALEVLYTSSTTITTAPSTIDVTRNSSQ